MYTRRAIAYRNHVHTSWPNHELEKEGAPDRVGYIDFQIRVAIRYGVESGDYISAPLRIYNNYRRDCPFL